MNPAIAKAIASLEADLAVKEQEVQDLKEAIEQLCQYTGDTPPEKKGQVTKPPADPIRRLQPGQIPGRKKHPWQKRGKSKRKMTCKSPTCGAEVYVGPKCMICPKCHRGKLELIQ